MFSVHHNWRFFLYSRVSFWCSVICCSVVLYYICFLAQKLTWTYRKHSSQSAKKLDLRVIPLWYSFKVTYLLKILNFLFSKLHHVPLLELQFQFPPMTKVFFPQFKFCLRVKRRKKERKERRESEEWLICGILAPRRTPCRCARARRTADSLPAVEIEIL